MTIKTRLTKLEKNTQPAQVQRITDAARLDRMKQLAQAIATEARAQGVTVQDDPRLALPLAIVEATA